MEAKNAKNAGNKIITAATGLFMTEIALTGCFEEENKTPEKDPVRIQQTEPNIKGSEVSVNEEIYQMKGRDKKKFGKYYFEIIIREHPGTQFENEIIINASDPETGKIVTESYKTKHENAPMTMIHNVYLTKDGKFVVKTSEGSFSVEEPK